MYDFKSTDLTFFCNMLTSINFVSCDYQRVNLRTVNDDYDERFITIYEGSQQKADDFNII
jgi:hypothetical protein